MWVWRPRRVKDVVRAAIALAIVPVLGAPTGPATPVAQVTPDAYEVVVEPSTDAPTGGLYEARFGVVPGARAGNGDVTVSSPKGTRVWTVSELSNHGLPAAAEKAYRRVAAQMASTDPGCQLPWTLLAGIGRVESDHGRYGGARLGSDGRSRPLIIGVQLNGAGPVAAIRDTDDGKLDGDRVWDRAVGPMQFIPSTWATSARDGDGDGRKSPHDLDDAAAAAAVYLCSGSGSLQDPGTQAAAIYRYNQDDYYVALVQAFEVGYRTGVFVMPAPPTDEETQETRKKKRRAVRRLEREATAVRTSAPRTSSSTTVSPKTTSTTTKPTASSPAPSPTQTPTQTSTPTPTPSPTPAPQPETVTALVTSCGTDCYELGGRRLDVAPLAAGDQANGDFDQDGTTETNGAELSGLVGLEATMVVVTMDSGLLGIYSINGLAV